jgi:hypothetical protein
MGLYVAICLLAALSAVSNHIDDEVDVFEIVWGTTLGLALAHWFAFRVSARLVAAGAFGADDAAVSGAQLVGAVAVAVISTVPVILLPSSSELDVVRLVLAVFIGLVGYAVARRGGANVMRSVVYGVGILVVAAVVAVVKNVLSGH